MASKAEYEASLADDDILISVLLVPYVFSKVYQVFFAILSVSSILYFVIYCKSYLTFNLNIKILFYFQFLTCFVHASISGIAQIHHLIAAIFASQAEDIVLNPTFYEILHIPFVWSLFGTTSSLYLMVTERTLVSYFYPLYERNVKNIGIVMTTLAVMIPLFITIFILYGVKFDWPVISVVVTQPAAATRINLTFVVHIILYFVILIHSIMLHRYNLRLNGSPRSRTSLGLSSKYQMSENVTSSQILWQLTLAQTTIYLFYATAMFSMRVFVAKPRHPIWIVLTELAYTPPIYCSVMPLLCIYTIRKSQKDRNKKITKIVGMSSTGTEGWDNYQKMLKDQWA